MRLNQPNTKYSGLMEKSFQHKGFINLKKCAFTLAEVLITIGIIGVVAAITIPNLITAYEKKVAVENLKKANSVLAQALKFYTAETGEDAASNFDATLSAKEYAEKYFVPYLKVSKICTKMSDGCWRTEDFYGYYDLAGNKMTDTVPYSIILHNGMVIGFNEISGYSYLKTIVVDVDGQKRRNVMGKDVFSFYPYNKAYHCNEPSFDFDSFPNGLYPGGFANCGVPHVTYSIDELINSTEMLRSCNKNASNGGGGKRPGVGQACAAVIFKNGWKMPSNYPW